jgi:sugar phosphate permease
MFTDSICVQVTRQFVFPHLQQSKPQNPYIMDNVFKFMGGFFTSLTQLLIGFAALAVVTEVVFGAEMFPGMTVVDNLTSLITTLGNGGFVGLVALLILWNILTKK